MLKIVGSACIEAPVEKTWAVLSDLESIAVWSEDIVTATCLGDQKRGVGAQRECVLSEKIKITELIVAWDEGKSYTYVGSNIPLVKSARNTWSVKSENGKTLLTTESEVVMKGGMLGRLLEPLMHFIALKLGAKTIAAFKYLVENGKPYEGKHSALPRALPVC